jgi:hypothetical protein
MATSARASVIEETIVQRQLRSGGWSFSRSQQASLEATSLAALALAPTSGGNLASAARFLMTSQLVDGSWPAFEGDSEGSWTTALAICTLTALNDVSDARDKALRWLLKKRGNEAFWFWRWKFQIADRAVRFDPGKYGWPWVLGSSSWVIPTAFSVVAIKQFTVCNRVDLAERRIRLGVEMLLDRACIGGGWNCGNSLVYGVPLKAHIEATAIALLALQDEPRGKIIQESLIWLMTQTKGLDSVSSLAWSILSLFVYQQPVGNLKDRLERALCNGANIKNTAVLAVAVLALNCGETIHPFEVLR